MTQNYAGNSEIDLHSKATPEIERNKRPDRVKKNQLATYVDDEVLSLVEFVARSSGVSISFFIEEAIKSALSKSELSKVTTSMAIRKQAILTSFDKWFERYVTLERIALYEPGRPKEDYQRDQPVPFFVAYDHYLAHTPAWQHCTKVMFGKKMKETIPDYHQRYGRFTVDKRQEWSFKGLVLSDKLAETKNI